MKLRILTALLLIVTLSSCNLQRQAASPQSDPSPTATAPMSDDMGGMNMNSSATPTFDGSGMTMDDADGGMNMPQMHDGPHMHMTAPRTPQLGDQASFDQIVQAARNSLSKYQDYKLAEQDGFKPFLPNVPMQIYHFTNSGNAIAEGFRFDPTKPTSLLYQKDGSSYKLVGVMYTAPNRFSEDQLNRRVPLSLAPWHQHTNLCLPPKGQGVQMLGSNPQFGLNGSIVTKPACDAAGGTFYPIIFDWMVHIYPWQS